jgi:hypothetical protein
MKKISMFKFIFALSIILLTRACVNPNEKDGKCTKCPPTDILSNGSCHVKIRGCLKQEKYFCKQCQNAYTLVKNICVR